MVAISPNPSTFAGAKIQLKNGKRKTENGKLSKKLLPLREAWSKFTPPTAKAVIKLKLTYTVAVALLALALTSCGGGKHTSAQADAAIDSASIELGPQRLRLLFAGDAMCHMPQVESACNEDGSLDFRPSLEGVKSYFDQADIAVVNLETTISPNSNHSGYPRFASPAEFADALAWLGTDVALLANNHCCDKGAKGVRATIAKLDTLGIAHTVAFHSKEDYEKNNILRFERNGIKLSLINYTYGTNGNPIPKSCIVNLIDTVQIANDIALALNGADCVVACMHWGYEYQRKPAPSQRQLAKFLHRHGVDIVVGAHPHVIQPNTASEEQITIYSLGNFISNQQDRYADGGLLAEIEVEKVNDSLCKYSLRTIPVWVKKNPGHKLISAEFASEEEMSDTQRTLYNRFISDTERLLKNGVKF